jgi:hypothetical protein
MLYYAFTLYVIGCEQPTNFIRGYNPLPEHYFAEGTKSVNITMKKLKEDGRDRTHKNLLKEFYSHPIILY